MTNFNNSKNTNGYTMYHELNQFDKPIQFYENDSTMPTNIETSYDGYQYHLVCKKDYFDFCLKDNIEAQKELAKNLRRMNSISVNLKYLLRVILFMIVIAIPFGIGTKLLILELPFVEQKSIINTIYLLITVYIIGHLFRLFVANKYKKSRYRNIFNTIKNEDFQNKTYSYFNKHRYPISGGNPLNLVWLKNLFRLGFIFSICFFIYSIMIVLGNGELSLGHERRSFYDTAKFFLPIEVSTDYELSSVTPITTGIYGSVMGEADYLIESSSYDFYDSDNYKIRDMEFNQILNSMDLFTMHGLINKFPIKSDITIFTNSRQESLLQGNYEEVDFVIYNLESQTVLFEDTIIDGEYAGDSNFDIVSFDYDEEHFYLLARTTKLINHRMVETYRVFELIDDEFVLNRNLPLTNHYYDINYFNGMLYFTYYNENTSYDITHLGKGTPSNHDFMEFDQSTILTFKIMEVDNELYLKGGGIYKLIDDSAIDLIGLDNFGFNNNYNYDALFVVGDTPETIQVYNEDGTYIIENLPNTIIDSEWSVKYMEGTDLIVMTSSTKYVFSKTDTEYPLYKQIPGLGEFMQLEDVNLKLTNSYIWGAIIIVTLMPYIRSTNALLKKNKHSNKINKEKY